MASLYLHIPFCEHKCIYCDFYSIENLSRVDPFLKALDQEIRMYAHYGTTEAFETIFFGGGTPSLLSAQQLENVLSRLYTTFSITSDAEITVEANPGTVDPQKLADYRSLGVNRLSVGVQAFHESELRFLTRIHSAQQAKTCIRDAHDVGFDNVNIDLIFALPSQTLEQWQSNVQQALALEPEHLSAYSLIVERGTPLARMVASKQVAPLPTDQDAEMYVWTMAALADAGYQHYEISNYARPGYQCRHNSNYWNHSSYLGFGPSAHAFWLSAGNNGLRWWNVANLRTYIEKISSGLLPIAGDEHLTESELLEEAIMLGLRSRGIDLHCLQQRYGIDLLNDAQVIIQDLIDGGYALLDNASLRLTDRGYLVCDEIVQHLLVSVEHSGVTV